LLPVVKEAVELLFSRSLVKILIATETFAMGVNMPARSVIFTAWVKHDGAQRRALLPSEYTQMAGRAGRRGLDSEGHVFLLCGDEVPDQKQITRMMTSKAEPLASRFRVTFAMILQMKRFAESGVRVEDLLGQSFLENARARRRPEARRHLKDRMQQLEALPALQCILGEPDIQEQSLRSWELSEGLGEASV
ncbi:SKI2, partial [Symbiodinium sp. KB8]